MSDMNVYSWVINSPKKLRKTLIRIVSLNQYLADEAKRIKMGDFVDGIVSSKKSSLESGFF